MGVYRRADSSYWWFWLESAPPGKKKVRSAIPIGHTVTERKASRALADEAYHAAMTELGKVRHGLHVDKPAIVFNTFVEWYDAHVIEHHRGAMRERDILKILRATFGEMLLSDITRKRVLEWRTARAAKTSATTSNRELDVLKQLLAAAVPTYLAESPVAKMKRLRGARTETRVLSHKEEARLLKVLSPSDRALIICALDTLMRLSDIVNLRRDQDRGRYLLVVDPKVTPYRVPVSKRLRKALDTLPHAGPFYFPHRRVAANVRDHRGSVRSMLRRACNRAKPKIPYGRRKGGITFHGLRHTGTTRMVDAGVSLRIVQEIGGWKSMRQLERYAHPTEQAKLAAVEQIGSRHVPARGGKKGKVA